MMCEKLLNKFQDKISEELMNNAKKILEYSIYSPTNINIVDNILEITFAQEEIYTIKVYNNKYITTKLYVNNTSKTKEYELTEIYKIINHIKILYNGNPNSVVVFTGSFNPPTIAHYHMIESALNTNKFDYVFFAIANERFLSKKQKRNKDWYYSETDRLNLILEMTYKHPKVLISGIEEGYTYDVLTMIKRVYKCNTVYFACGSDKLSQIPKWGRHNDLLKEFGFYILIRDDEISIVKEQCDNIFNQYIIGKDNEKYSDLSATKVRTCISNNQNFKDYVTKEVYEYMKNNNLERML